MNFKKVNVLYKQYSDPEIDHFWLSLLTRASLPSQGKKKKHPDLQQHGSVLPMNGMKWYAILSVSWFLSLASFAQNYVHKTHQRLCCLVAVLSSHCGLGFWFMNLS